MTRIRREQQFRIYDDSASSPEFVFQQEIAAPIGIPPQRVFPVQGRVESVTFNVTLADLAGVVTAALADSGGRLALHNRLVDVREREDGGAWSVTGAGRVASIAMTPDATAYVFSIGDERLVERRTELFKGEADTTVVVPHGLRYALANNLPAVELGSVKVTHVTKAQDVGQDDGRYLLCELDVDMRTDAALQYIIEDLKDGEDGEYPRQGVLASFLGFGASALGAVAGSPTGAAPVGNFKTLRILLDENNANEIVSFDITHGPGEVVASVRDPIPGHLFIKDVQETLATEPVDEDGKHVQRKLHCWVAYGDGTLFPSFGSADAVLGAEGKFMIVPAAADPTDKLPLHIGVDDVTHAYGRTALGVGNIKFYGWHPFALLEELYTNAGVRMDAAAFTALKNDPRYGFMTLRVTQTWNLAKFAETFFYKPYGVMPFLDAQGRLAPKAIHLPNADDVDVTTLFEFNAHNISEPPSFDTTGRDAVTRIETAYDLWSYITDAQYQAAATPVAVTGVTRVVDVDTALPMDRIMVRPIVQVRDGDRLAQLGTLAQRFEFAGIHSLIWSTPILRRIARETEARYQDGPIRTLVRGLSACDDVQAGDFVKLNVATYPNLATGERGGVRIMQALGKGRPQLGAWLFELIDLGPSMVPLSAPTCTVAQNSASPRHSVAVTVGSVPTDGWVLVEYAVNATEPGATSALWRTMFIATANGTFYHHQLPSNSTVWVRARAYVQGRIASTWSTADDATTASISPPTSPTMSSITQIAARLSWTPGEDEYETEVLLDQATCAGASLQRIATVAQGQTLFDFFGLTGNATHCAGVRHVDPYGGVSTTANVQFATLSGAIPVPDMAGMALLVGTPL